MNLTETDQRMAINPGRPSVTEVLDRRIEEAQRNLDDMLAARTALKAYPDVENVLNLLAKTGSIGIF